MEKILNEANSAGKVYDKWLESVSPETLRNIRNMYDASGRGATRKDDYVYGNSFGLDPSGN